MAEVIVNVGANTQDANAQINQLNQSLGKTGDAAAVATKENAQLEATLKKQEATIKTIDGAVNLLGGSVELLASSLVLSGAASKEQAEEFEAVALGAIAFADGAKRTVDGVKSLNEGLAASGGIIGTVTKSFNALKAAIIANPFTAVAVAIAAVVSALLIYNETTKESTEDTEEYKKAVEGLNKSLREQQAIAGVNANSVGVLANAYKDGKLNADQLASGLKALGINVEGVNLSTEKNIKLVNDLAQANNNIASQQAKRTKLEGELKLALEENRTRAAELLRDEIAEIDVNTASYRANADAIIANFDSQKKANEQKSTSIELTKQETTEVLNYKDAVEKRNQAIKEGIEGFIEGTGGIEQPTNTILRQLPIVQEAVEQSAATFADYLNNLNTNLNEFFESNTAKAIAGSLSTAANLASVLAKSQDESTEEAFEKAKKYKIAEVVTSAIQASFQAFGAAQQFGPILGPILGAAQVLAIGIASSKAIQDIQSSSFNSPGSPSTSTGGGSTPAVSRATAPNLGGGFVTAGAPPVVTPNEPLRAYVVTGDVVNGIQASGQIQRRRTLGPG